MDNGNLPTGIAILISCVVLGVIIFAGLVISAVLTGMIS
jgi:hypothetical protein